ncbi:hypothetical protein C3747_32g174 [Trypanosoma cruzi]|uniref:UDP-GlcNAc:polypeptide N-acetylglucosaminyltransferase n=2 Tax=Trypanosoma cruzi TaxID=5693 RepID=Q4E338_TRYCC|nr:hypothetical protein, conserved [Trypanosoma cruzi]EAN99214.1 hypothetical protein, conserved [Trypanosoma cruzi]PWV15008.1 hypothetical protein C3747_32g174 [Trypanosoma cruzi]RNC46822.1 UDP-GlcNAc:polypeptide N-acetylglucosaminyltransferase [Trypanosoma cruzi]|eukprot:XP_821065.1 hypothetical protein [Trypanosoma cruzi strain CL Brener]
MQFEETNLLRRHTVQNQRPNETAEKERRSGRPYRFDVKRSKFQMIRDAVDSFLRSDARVIQALAITVVVLVLLCLALIGMSAWLLLHGPENEVPHVRDEKFFDNDAIMDIWRLYEMAMRTKDAYHEAALHDYLIRYKTKVNEKKETWKREHNVETIDVHEIQDDEPPVLAPYTSSPKVGFSTLMASLRRVLNRIELQGPKDGLERAANFVEKKMKETSSAESHKRKIFEEGEASEPFDDILYLQLHRLYESEKENTASIPEHKRAWWQRVKKIAPSIYTKRFYYPLRRFHRLRRFSAEKPEETAAWFNALVDDYYGDHVTHFSTPKISEEFAPSIADVIGEGEASSSELDSLPHTGSLFLNIASFRDKECWPSIDHMIQRSTNMFRVYWGVAQQHYYSDLPCVSADALKPQPCVAAPTTSGVMIKDANFDGAICFPSDNIRIRRIRSFTALGPAFGRYMSMLLYGGEDYMLVLDSHNRFVYAWDARIIAMQVALEHPKAVLSHYPESYAPPEKGEFAWERKTTAYLCQAKFLNTAGYLRLVGIIIGEGDLFTENARHLKPYAIPGLRLRPDVVRPLAQPWAAGGFLFANASVMREVPFDPHLPHLFDGEEVMYSVRLWTHGYDIFSPKRGICYHFYDRPNEPKLWNEAKRWYASQTYTRRRIQYFLRSRLMGVDVLRVPKNTQDPVVMIDADRYGTGRLRTVDEWYEFAGADPVRYTVDGRWCG